MIAGDAGRRGRAGTSETAAEAKKSRAAHPPFNTLIDMIVLSASSHLRDKGKATAICRHTEQRTKRGRA